jgi:SAM-dependent methyltransferase
MSTSAETFQLSLDAAEAYESKFVPALFGEWAPHLVDAAAVHPGQAVLDVACGTGVVARAAAQRLAGEGTVVGVDLNEAMLTVARRIASEIDWRQGDACALPFPDASFDVVLCQAALMFFPEPAQALREMARVARDEGTVAVQVWASLDAQPAYGPFVEVAARYAGPEAVSLLSAYWVLGDLDFVCSLLDAAGLDVTARATRLGIARYDSIEELVRIEVESTPLVDRIDADVYGRILAGANEALAAFRTSEGRAEIPIAGHLLTGRKRPVRAVEYADDHTDTATGGTT